MCTVLLPPGDNPIAFNKYIIYTTLRTAYLDEILSDHPESRPTVVYIIHIYKETTENWQLWRLIVTYFNIQRENTVICRFYQFNVF